jgi:uncharacterized protein (DUF433 family)
LTDHRDPTRATFASIITEDPAVLGGQPCIRGTRIPVRDVAASSKAGIPLNEILAGYPDLTADDIALAVAYATANPPTGRPLRVADTWPNAILSDERAVGRATVPLE